MLGSLQESSRKGNTVAFVIQDHATKWTECHRAHSKSANDTILGLMLVVGCGEMVKRLYMDGSGELSAAVRDLSWRHDVSTPQRPHSNGVAEQAVR